MNRSLADYVARLIAMTFAAGITALTIFVHAADRTQLGAPMATSTTFAARQGDPMPAETRATRHIVALAASDLH
jgi:hypothetical protein